METIAALFRRDRGTSPYCGRGDAIDGRGDPGGKAYWNVCSTGVVICGDKAGNRVFSVCGIRGLEDGRCELTLGGENPRTTLGRLLDGGESKSRACAAVIDGSREMVAFAGLGDDGPGAGNDDLRGEGAGAGEEDMSMKGEV